MHILTYKELKQSFLNFFKNREHEEYDSSPLVPRGDSTLMFANSGMVQFKDIFLNIEKPMHKRVVTVQKCLRAGGKHNDLEQVGKTKRHHTFFEMLGNFSFGDYFKKEAINLAWDFLINHLNINKDNLYVTVHKSDHESYEIWSHLINKNKIIPVDSEDNFWSMGETGPCGPCTEIFYDNGEHLPGTLESTKYDPDERFIEIWNIVFMQYNKTHDKQLVPLKNKCVDTGIGLERMLSVCQNVKDNYETDLFKQIIQQSMHLTKNEKNKIAHKIIADHTRAAVFMIADGIVPSNIGRGYVLRRILRRAINQVYKLECHDGKILAKIAETVILLMHEDYEIILNEKKTILDYISDEECKFIEVLKNGMDYLSSKINKGEEIYEGLIFKLYDTYGFPIDLTYDILDEQGIKYDSEKVEHLLEQQRSRGRLSWQGEEKMMGSMELSELSETKKLFYEAAKSDAQIIAIINDDNKVNSTTVGSKSIIILNQTTFYAECGGQAGDIGHIFNKKNELIANVLNTKFSPNKKLIFHYCEMLGNANVGDSVIISIDERNRRAIARNHSATHLLQSAIKKIVDPKISQKGSSLNSEYLRFDFNIKNSLIHEDKIEQYINSLIELGLKSKVYQMNLKNAISMGAIALFEDKYEKESVRVVSFENEKGEKYSIELCGGTHVHSTTEILAFKITAISSIGSGIKRIEAITGHVAISILNRAWGYKKAISALLNDDTERSFKMIKEFKSKIKALENQINDYSVSIINDSILPYINENNDSQLPTIIKKINEKIFIIFIKKSKTPKNGYSGAEKLLSQINNNASHLIILECVSEKYLKCHIISQDAQMSAQLAALIENKQIDNKDAKNKKYIKIGLKPKFKTPEQEIEDIENKINLANL